MTEFSYGAIIDPRRTNPRFTNIRCNIDLQQIFVMPNVKLVYGLSCPVFVHLGFVVSSVWFFRISESTDPNPIY